MLARAGRATAAGVISVVLVLISCAQPGCTPHRRRNATFCDPDSDAGFSCPPPDVCVRYTCVSATGGGGNVDAGGGTHDANGDGAFRDATDDARGTVTDDAAADGLADAGAAADAKADADAPSTCGLCPISTPLCDPNTVICQACATNDQCARLSVDTPFCEGGTCVGCLTKDDCSRNTPLCAAATRKCTGCQDDTACKNAFPALPVCNGGACVECVSDPSCPAAKPHCDANHACAQCTTNDQCAKQNIALPVCSGGTCFECGSDSDCPVATKPICMAHACKPCTTDKQCVGKLGADPGVCMFQSDGHCAADGEAIYVTPIPASCDDSTGAPASATKPFCTPQRAILAVSPTKSLIVIRPGTTNLSSWTYSRISGVNELTVIGQNGATIDVGAGAGITVNSGTVYIRALNVSAMPDVGIYAAGSDTLLKLDRCVVTKNKGGLQINGATADIGNCVFAENTNNTAAPARTFAGVYLSGVGTKSIVFRNNTVYGNDGMGLNCDGAYIVRGLLVGNNTGGQITLCDYSDGSTVAIGTATFNPQFDPARPYHLTAASSCVDKGSATDFPPDDIDGNPRPSGVRSDCGAHELQQAP